MLNLSERQLLILESLIKNFIGTANPIGSRFLSKKIQFKLSPATIRNTMNELEDLGLICQPHTSAGRIPTDKGYRLFVDRMMRSRSLTIPEMQAIHEKLNCMSCDQDLILTRSSQVLSEISRQLGIVLAPRFEKGLFNRLEIIKLSEKRVLVVISIKSGLVRTITIELKSEISAEKIDETIRILNERLHGLSLGEIQMSIGARMDDIALGDIGLINLFIESADQLFRPDLEGGLHLEGALHVAEQPEFADVKKTRKMLDLIENKRNVLFHVLSECDQEDSISILIGNENQEKLMKDFSLVAATYCVGDVKGVLGVIGPTRMQYAKMVALVDYMARSVARALGNG
ncbi:heat-inducible transcriptional repressor HrcA [candidate division KSB1 bacterium]|nr:heat-inducible transcriptional repressor HrcA [candidate division KSB1 bacterium]